MAHAHSRLSQVLVGVDFSAPSRLALARALQVARTANAALEVVHVLKHRRLLNPGDQELAQTELEELVASVAKSVAPADPTGPSTRLRARVLTTDGHISDVLRTEAAALGAQLIVLGRTGRGLLRGLLLGSTTERLARFDDRTLLLVHPDSTVTEPYQRPLVATDFSDEAHRALVLGQALAPEAKTLDVLHVYDRSYAMVLRASASGVDRVAQYDDSRRAEAEKAMQSLLARHAGSTRPTPPFVPHIIGGDPRPDVREQALRLSSDLLVVGRRGETGAGPLGAVAEGLLRIAPTDFALTGRPSFETA